MKNKVFKVSKPQHFFICLKVNKPVTYMLFQYANPDSSDHQLQVQEIL